ncbi:M20/M25/M40 family metallo-hydrolase [Solirubrobacter sp. CPCC 204708]|uniref:M20/M25/M40 family metallo-hydrolase n=1 Tax=Solirubrobacter deserti TaxID=2282478 RepID=A0ABT4RU21_9ACTN|nr:M20/M25/M40 family metallo-hydrolase [Solirubrobacter deserti]MBE2316246.1 M20/M25/M40 family metallo-hydrolase [Solirubrobacter deserti]MDA0142074.1 M20/M25/M40 family metallo-hydrolase [Solirubrobacter deserti]
MNAARRVLERADELAGFTEEPGRITRPLGTAALTGATERVADWMYESGLETATDALGNLVGRRGEGARLLMGSHLDSVADAGRYDGVLGVLVALEVADATHIPLEVVAFADEEGLRYGSTFLGSRAFVGQLTADEEAMLGVSIGSPLFAGAKAYFEVHIEQGPVLEALDRPLGVVTAIAGQSRYALTFVGRADHAGTTPMALRDDALVAAARFVLAVEGLASETEGLVATVGRLAVPGGAVNVVPGRVELSLDVRHADDTVRQRALDALRALSGEAHWELIHEHDATPCAVEALAAAIGPDAPRLVSGAGHDVVTMAAFTDVALLFVRSTGGSHNPHEAVREEDVAAAIDVATRYACSI